MKRLSLLILLIVLLAGLGVAATSAQGSDFPTVITVAAAVFDGPGPEYNSLGAARVGVTIRIDGRTFNGNWVRGLLGDGRVGWVSSGTVRITYGELIGLVIIDVTTPFFLEGTAQAPAPSTLPAGDTEAGAPAPTPVEGLLPNIADGYDAGIPAGPRINRYLGDHAAQIFPMLTGDGEAFLHIYRIVDSEGWLIMSVTEADVAAYRANPPAEAVVLKREDGPGYYGPALLYFRPDGVMEFRIGPDGENRTQVMVFEGPEATELNCWYVVVPVGIVGNPETC